MIGRYRITAISFYEGHSVNDDKGKKKSESKIFILARIIFFSDIVSFAISFCSYL